MKTQLTAASASVLALLAVAACHEKPDMSRGGIELVGRFLSVPGPDGAEAGREVIARRLERLRIPAVVVREGMTIRVGLVKPDSDALALVKAQLALGGKLEMREVDSGAVLPELVKALPEGSGLELSESPLPEGGKTYAVKARRPGDAAAALNALQAKLPKELELLPEEQDGPGGEQAGVIFHPVRAAAITGKDVGDASVKMDQQMGRPYVALTFTPQGAKTFEELTGRIVGRKLAIALDGRVLSAPVVMSAIRGGKAQITLGGWSGPREQRAQADAIAVALTAGALPSTLVVEEERVVPAR